LVPAAATQLRRLVGRLERSDGMINLNADHLAALVLPVRSPSRDFR
jgi:hypothetical protein